ncbi:MAG: hypothetical protein HC869_08785 [Rhodospirillales bacterium]|nr:hypothetical protein [Rhodospirillales bacterium]
MLVLIDSSAPHEAHPAYWAPFVLGDGDAEGNLRLLVQGKNPGADSRIWIITRGISLQQTFPFAIRMRTSDLSSRANAP